MNNNCDHKKVLIQIRDLRIGNGIASCIMNYYEYTIQNGFSIDFLLNRDLDSPYRNIVLNNGSRIFTMPHDTSKPNKDNVAYIKQIASSGYDILHVNTSGYYALCALRIAKRNGIKARIYHAHNPKEPLSLKVGIRNVLYLYPSIWYSNCFAACSMGAGKSVFGAKPFTVIHNAMELSKYKYDVKKRTELRDSLGVSNGFVVGVVGRMEKQKNPLFLVDIFAEFRELNPNAFLIWVGDGSLKRDVQKRIQDKNLSDCVLLLGTRTDVNKLYSAMDMFLLPSQYEGLGLVFVEAQISGLQCFGSDRVPSDVEISENMHRVPLMTDAKKWAAIMDEHKDYLRTDVSDFAAVAGFDITKEAHSVAALYSHASKGRR